MSTDGASAAAPPSSQPQPQPPLPSPPQPSQAPRGKGGAGFWRAICHAVLAVDATWRVALAGFLWFAATTAWYPLMLPDEGRYVGVARNMLQAGEAWVPLLNDLPFFHKPPLFYWVTGLSLQTFGVNEWAARMSSVLGATLMVAATFWLLRREAGQRVAALAAAVLATAPLLYGGAHYANLDMTVAGLITATIVAGVAAALRIERSEPARETLLCAYLLAGLAFLAKGLIGLALPGGVLVFWLLGRRRFRVLGRMFWLPGLAALLLVTLPWMLYMQWRYEGFFDYYIVHQHIERFLQSGFNNPRPFWFYAPVVILLTLPWSAPAWRLLQPSWWRAAGTGPLDGLMAVWFLLIFIFFSLPTSKLLGYILPVLPPVAYFLARLLAQRPADARGAPRGYALLLGISAGLCLAAAVAIALAPPRGTKALAEAMSARFSPEHELIMLDRYRHDVPFYLETRKPARIVLDWDDPAILRTDSWRREFADTARFAPALAAELLLRPAQLQERLCQPRDTGWWLLGELNTVLSNPFLVQAEQAYVVDGVIAWWIPPEQTFIACAGTPSAGTAGK